MSVVKKITQEEAKKIIETRKPRGLFYSNEEGKYVAIDNMFGDAFVEEFKTLRSAMIWLMVGGDEECR